MARGRNGDAVEGERAPADEARLVLGKLRDDRQLGAVLVRQADRVGVEARDNVQLDLGPAHAQGIHRGHQPVETGMAFDGNAQLARAARSQPGQIALGAFHLGQHAVGQRQQPQTDGRELRRHGLALEQWAAKALFEQLDLMGQGRLGQVEQLRRAHQASGVTQREQRAQVADFENGAEHY